MTSPRESAIIQRWMMTPGAVPEGRCSGDGCWYTLPLVDGLIVTHSGAGVLAPCAGGGRPPLPVRRIHTAVLVARCEGVSEPDGVPCTGQLRFVWGMVEAACATCGGRCGIAVANWTSIEAAT